MEHLGSVQGGIERTVKSRFAPRAARADPACPTATRRRPIRLARATAVRYSLGMTFALLAAIALGWMPAQEPKAASSADLHTALQERLDAFIAGGRVPGAS